MTLNDLLTHPVTVVAFVGGVVSLLIWIGKVEEHRTSVGKFMEEIRTRLDKIFDKLQTPVAGASPLKLTELGDKMAAFMKAQDWASELAPRLLPQVVNKQPFEVDMVAQDYVADRLDDEMGRRVAACAYEFGREATGVRNVLHVVLRDELLRLSDTAH